MDDEHAAAGPRVRMKREACVVTLSITFPDEYAAIEFYDRLERDAASGAKQIVVVIELPDATPA